MRENEKLVVVAQYDNGFDAELAKLLLDNEGIPCFLAGAKDMPYPTVVVAEIQVFESDVERAMEILDHQQPLDDSEESGDVQ
jgi:hypothetical protein